MRNSLNGPAEHFIRDFPAKSYYKEAAKHMGYVPEKMVETLVAALQLSDEEVTNEKSLGELRDALVAYLSPRMLRMAKKRGCYDMLREAEMLAFLGQCEPGRHDLIVAADVLVYVGDPAPVFAAAARALSPRGLFAFSIQRGDSADFSLGRDRRFSHRPAYVKATLAAAGFSVTRCEEDSTRTKNGKPVPGAIFVAMRGSESPLARDRSASLSPPAGRG